MDAAFMQLKQHERGIHALRSASLPPGRGRYRTPPATPATHATRDTTAAGRAIGRRPGRHPDTSRGHPHADTLTRTRRNPHG